MLQVQPRLESAVASGILPVDKIHIHPCELADIVHAYCDCHYDRWLHRQGCVASN